MRIHGSRLALVSMILICVVSIVVYAGCGETRAVPLPMSPPMPGGGSQLPPITTSGTLDQLTIGKMNLFYDFWPVVNFQPTVPAHRSEIRLFPMSGVSTDQPDSVGGEITVSHDDLYNLNSTKDYHVMSIYAYNEEYRLQSQAGGNATPYPIKFDSMGGIINFSLNTDGSLGIARGISNSEGAGGFAHQRVQSCTGQNCKIQLTWITAFGDTNYTATCTLGGATGIVNWVDKEPGYLLLLVTHVGASQGGEIDCIGVHD